MKMAIIIGGLIIIIVGIWFLQSSAPNDSAVDVGTNEEATMTGSETTLTTAEEDAAAGAEADTSAESDTSAVGEVTIEAFNFGYSMDEIRVNEGDTITVTLTNSDGFHDWVLDEFDAATEQISEGETTTVTFVADKVGTYEYYCSVGNHREQGMVGTLIVE